MFGCAPAGGNSLSISRKAAAKSKSAKSINTDNMFSVKLNNGVEMPAIGFGTWAIADGSDVVEAVKTAIECGFRHIDTASFYKNEEGVGRGIAESGISRGNLWVTTKVWPTETGYDNTLRAFDASLKRLGLDYIDLYLIHWPATASQYSDWRERNLDTWRAFERLYADGRVRAIGVSNFLASHLQPLIDSCKVRPMVDQLEIHPGYRQADDVAFCQANGIQVEAWSPFGRGSAFKSEELRQLAAKYGRTVAQVCVAWCLQKHIVPLPKSVTPERMKENLNAADFKLSESDIAMIDQLANFGWSGQHPDEVKF